MYSNISLNAAYVTKFAMRITHQSKLIYYSIHFGKPC